MFEDVIKKYEKDLKGLEDIARKQDNKIDLSIILITMKCNSDDLTDVFNYFSFKDIEIVNEGVELDFGDEDEPTDIDKKVTPFDPSKIDIKMDKITVDSIIKRIINDELEFDSSFQRKSGLWKLKQKSQLIESIILKIPLPAFYFDASDDDKWQIIDGLQRIGTLKEFIVDQSFELTGMEFLTDLDGLKFDQLPRSLQRRIEETNLNAYLVNPSTPKNVKFNIFKRINTGGLVLEAQEIRNALYQGQATKFLQDMSKQEDFRKATDYSIKTDRMLDREFCLRYVAFTKLDLEVYNGSMDDFLNEGMQLLSTASREELAGIMSDFKLVMDSCWKVFHKNAFRRIGEDNRRGPVNKALFETWSIIMNRLTSEEITLLIQRKDIITEKFNALCNEYNFLNAIKASDKYSLKTRITKVEEIVKETIQA